MRLYCKGATTTNTNIADSTGETNGSCSVNKKVRADRLDQPLKCHLYEGRFSLHVNGRWKRRLRGKQDVREPLNNATLLCSQRIYRLIFAFVQENHRKMQPFILFFYSLSRKRADCPYIRLWKVFARRWLEILWFTVIFAIKVLIFQHFIAKIRFIQNIPKGRYARCRNVGYRCKVHDGYGCDCQRHSGKCGGS